jgi:hypothetical protein
MKYAVSYKGAAHNTEYSYGANKENGFLIIELEPHELEEEIIRNKILQLDKYCSSVYITAMSKL